MSRILIAPLGYGLITALTIGLAAPAQANPYGSFPGSASVYCNQDSIQQETYVIRNGETIRVTEVRPQFNSSCQRSGIVRPIIVLPIGLRPNLNNDQYYNDRYYHQYDNRRDSRYGNDHRNRHDNWRDNRYDSRYGNRDRDFYPASPQIRVELGPQISVSSVGASTRPQNPNQPLNVTNVFRRVERFPTVEYPEYRDRDANDQPGYPGLDRYYPR
jgi:hypothetical protein